MSDLVERLKEKIITDAFVEGDITSGALADRLIRERLDAADEIERLLKYEKLVQFIANDYWELSYHKVEWQRNDWRNRCRKLIEEDQ